MRYPGGKNCAGTYQKIINEIPPHRVFVELFAGSAAITRWKRPAERTILIDSNPEVLCLLRGRLPAGTDCLAGDALAFLKNDDLAGDWFLYADPPYMHVRSYYAHKFSAVEHAELLGLLKRCPCKVMISGYRTTLYNNLLRDWRRLDFRVITRGGKMGVESLWMNYDPPAVLHDPRYAGRDYRQRENLARKKRRWQARIERMPHAERQLLLEALTGGLDTEERAALISNLKVDRATAGMPGGDRHG